VAGQREAPASIGQRLLWVLDHYRGAGGALNCPILCRISGQLDIAILAQAVYELTVRHEILRTTFTGRGPRLTQVINPPRAEPLVTVDLSGSGAPGATVGKAIAAELATRIDPSVWPLRATLWRVGDTDHVLCLNMHHLVSDAVSCGIVFRDLRSLVVRAAGGSAPLPPLGWQYEQFARWQLDLVNSGGLRRAQDYWQRQLAGALLPELPGQALARPGPAKPGPATSAKASIDLDEVITRALREVAQVHRTTLFTVLLAVYFALLHRVTAQRDLSVASLFANRTRPEVKSMVGFVANMVLLRARMSGRYRFAHLLSQTHRTVTGAFVHQDLPYQLLPINHAALGVQRADGVVFQMLAEPMTGAMLGAADAELLVPDGIGSRFDMELVLIPRDGTFRVVLFYNASRLRRTWAGGFVTDFAALAAAAASSPEATLDTLYTRL
jgi:hypothetical protein